MQPQYDRFEFSSDFNLITLFPDSDFFAPYEVETKVFVQWAIDNDLSHEHAYNDSTSGLVVFIAPSARKAQSYTYSIVMQAMLFVEKENRRPDAFFKHHISELMAMYAEDTTFDELDPEEAEHEIINDAVDFRRTQ